MANVIDFSAAKAERQPHSAGNARCLDCKHEWEAIAPVGVIWMECPACSLVRGRFIGQHERQGSEWICHCGNDLFHITPQGPYCPNCGEWVEGN